MSGYADGRSTVRRQPRSHAAEDSESRTERALVIAVVTLGMLIALFVIADGMSLFTRLGKALAYH